MASICDKCAKRTSINSVGATISVNPRLDPTSHQTPGGLGLGFGPPGIYEPRILCTDCTTELFKFLGIEIGAAGNALTPEELAELGVDNDASPLLPFRGDERLVE